MTTNEYFQVEPDDTFAHPRLRRWQALLQRAGATGSVEVYRADDLLGPGPATLCVTIGDQQDEEPWSPEVNRGLVALGVPGRTPADESLRFALALASAFEPIEAEVGEGYFNAVLLQQLAGSAFEARLRTTLAQIYSPPPHVGTRWASCDDQIRHAIRSRAHELTAQLGHAPAEAEAILGDALDRYLDDRFHVSSRRALGLGA